MVEVTLDTGDAYTARESINTFWQLLDRANVLSGAERDWISLHFHAPDDNRDGREFWLRASTVRLVTEFEDDD